MPAVGQHNGNWSNIIFYCLVAIMKKFAQLMLLFHWQRSSWCQVNIFWCSPSPRKTVASFNITDKREKGKRKFKSLFTWYLQTATLKATYPLQSNAVLLQSLCKVKPLQRDVNLSPNSSRFVFHENSNNLFFFNMFITYRRNKYDNNCFFDLYWEYYP